MVDDIRPAGAPDSQDENKGDPISASNFSSSQKPDNRLPGDADTQMHFGNEQEGFVVLPNGKGFKENPFKKISAKIRNLNKKQKAAALAAFAIVLIAAGGGAYALFHKSPPPPAPVPVVKQETPPPKPTTVPSPLTGLPISPKLAKKHVTSIQIENSPDARPQSGLIDAGVVFEAIAEGGITRFNASFLETAPKYIGPIRSVRPYYADLAAPFDPVFVHAGGSEAGLRRLGQLKLKDLEHGANPDTFQRISSRYAPHNLYSSMAALDKTSAARGYKTSKVKSFERKDEEKGKKVQAATINMEISGFLYNTSYKYDSKNNVYKRFMAGKPHTDEKSGKQISPKVVVAMITSWHQSTIYSVYQTTGKGRALIFQDGQVYSATWRKKGPKEQITFTDANGKPIKLNAGQTWITLLRDKSEISYSP